MKYFQGALCLITEVPFYLLSHLELIWNSIIYLVTPSKVKNVTTEIHSSKTSGPDCIPVLLLKSYEPELSGILADIFNMFLYESEEVCD